MLRLGKLVYVTIGIKQIFTRAGTRAKLYMDDNEPICVNDLFFGVGWRVAEYHFALMQIPVTECLMCALQRALPN